MAAKFPKVVQTIIYALRWKSKSARRIQPPFVDLGMLHGLPQIGVPNLVEILNENERAKKPLRIQRVNLCLLENHMRHRTERFPIGRTNLVVRRGQKFEISLVMNRVLYCNDILNLVFHVSDALYPSFKNGSQVNVIVGRDCSHFIGPTFWTAGIMEVDNTIVKIHIVPAVTCPVGTWRLEIYTALLEDKKPNIYTLASLIYILFNPWNKKDQVYIENSHFDYVTGEHIKIWRGNYLNLNEYLFWSVDQYEPLVLESAIYLISEIKPVLPHNRGSPVEVSRALSSAINCNNNGGVLEGGWTSPLVHEFRGSREILQEYYCTKRPIKYAQCWVFAGVLTTVLRALGIPSRVVTGYNAAHDYDKSLTCNTIISGFDVIVNYALWNFHCWNEGWMSRPDLDAKGFYDGWQVVDSTPQEESDGSYQCGPSSVVAVKHGDLIKSYDTQFVYSEINADCVTWEYNEATKTWKILSIDKEKIGKCISTTESGSYNRLDITDNYKFRADSAKGYDIAIHALAQVHDGLAQFYLNEVFEEFKYSLVFKNTIITFGSNFDVVLLMKNSHGSTAYRAKGIIKFLISSYNGANEKALKALEFDVELPIRSQKEFTMKIYYREYKRLYQPNSIFQVRCYGKLEQIDYSFYKEESLPFTDPAINLVVTKTGNSLDRRCSMTLDFENPLDVPITKCAISLSTPLEWILVKLKPGPILMGEKVTHTLECDFRNHPPEFILTVNFSSKQLKFTKTFLMSNDCIVS